MAADLIGALLSALALLGTSGALFSDWMHMELARDRARCDQAVTISEKVLVARRCCSWASDWTRCCCSACRWSSSASAGPASWAGGRSASVIAGTVLLPFSPTSTNLVVAAAFLLIQLPLAVAGIRLIARGRASATEHPRRDVPPVLRAGDGVVARQPGGHSIRRPPSTWKCTWCTDWPACGPVLVTRR